MSERRRVVVFAVAQFSAAAAIGIAALALAPPTTLVGPGGGPLAAVIAAALLIALGSTGLFVVFARSPNRRRRWAQRALRRVFDHYPGGALALATKRPSGDVVLVGGNERAGALAGGGWRGTKPAALADVFGAPAADAVRELLARPRRPGDGAHLPALRDGAGDQRWRDLLAIRVREDRSLLFFEDVGERERERRQLREREALWRGILDVQMQAVMIVDQDQAIRFVNRAAESLFGQRAEALLGAPFGFPVVRGEVAEIEIIRPGRNVAFAEMQAETMVCEGEPRFVLFIRDVSAWRRAEGDLRKLFQAIEQSPTSVLITDVEGRIEYVNPKFTEATGYTYAEVAGKNPRILKSGYTSRHEYAVLWRTILGGKIWRGEFYNKRKDGRLIWEQTSIAPVRDVRGKITHFVAVKEDITDRKATEEKLRQAQKMETIGQLTGGIAHDFNNLLAIIVGNLQLLDERADIDRDSRELIADALWSAERGAQLTHRLLAFARRQRLHPKITRLNEVVAEMTDILRRTIGEKIIVREQLGVDLWPALVDRAQLESALLNLVVNARDAMPSGGVLTISAQNVILPRDDDPSFEDVPPGDYVQLAVRDTGIGMSKEVVGRIFEPFFTTKRFGEGSGLGLSMVYGFVRQSGGHVTVDSTLGRGTTVRILLPRALESENNRG